MEETKSSQAETEDHPVQKSLRDKSEKNRAEKPKNQGLTVWDMINKLKKKKEAEKQAAN